MATWLSSGADTGTNSVQDMHDNHANAGDIILIPNGTFSWGTGVTISKAVTVQAQNMPTNSGLGMQNPNQLFSPSGVFIQFANATLTQLMTVNASTAGNIKIAGLNFQIGATTQATGSTYVNVSNTTTNFPVLMHDCSWNVPNFVVLHTMQWFSGNGVIYNNWLFGSSPGVAAGTGSGGIYFESNIPWWQRSIWGALDTNGILKVYVENNLFENSYNQCLDCGEKSRVVIRDNQVNNSQFLTHGSTGTDGGREIEIYNNNFNYFSVKSGGQLGSLIRGISDNSTNQSTGQLSDGSYYPPMSRWFWMRAGTALIHDNTVQSQNTFGFNGPTPSAWSFVDESLYRNSANAPCETESAYPGWHWPGTAGQIDPNDPNLNNGSVYSSVGTNYKTSGYEIVSPIYIWNNTYFGQNQPSSQWTPSNGSPVSCPGGGLTQDVFLINRDIFLNAPPAPNSALIPAYNLNGFSSPGVTFSYTPFTYPHPLIAGGPPPDTTPPTVPGSFALGTPTSSSIPVSWALSTDPDNTQAQITYHLEHQRAGSAGAPTIKQANFKVNATGPTSIFTPFTGAQIANNTNLAWVWTSNGVSISAVTDTAGNIYSLLYGPVINNPAAWQLAVYYCNGIVSAGAGTNTVTAMFSSGIWGELIIAEYTGVALGGSPLDAASTLNGTGSPASQTITVTQSNDVIISWLGLIFANLGGLTPSTPTGYTLEETTDQSGNGGPGSSWIADTPGAVVSTPSWGNISPSENWTIANIGIKSVAAFLEFYTVTGTGTGSTSTTDTGLLQNTTYNYRLRASDPSGNFSAYTSTLSATTTGGIGQINATVRLK